MIRQRHRRQFLQHAAAMLGAACAAPLRHSLAAEPKPRFQPKFAICNETFGEWPFEKVCAFAAECGYAGVEIAPFTIANLVTDIPAGQRSRMRRQAESAGLQIVGLHWLLAKTTGFHLTSPDREIRRNTARYLHELARFCADLGGDLLVFGSPKQRNVPPGVSREEAMQYASEVLRETLPALEEADVKLALEPLSHRTTNFLQTAAEAAALVQNIDSPRCRLILDCVAMSSETTPIPDLLRRYASLLAHFHANDPNSQGPGFGKLDFHPILQTLGELNYQGWVSVEVFDYSPGPERLARESIKYMRQVLEELG